MFIKNVHSSIVPMINFYPSIFYNLTKGFIPCFTETFNKEYKKFKSDNKEYFNFKHEYYPSYNPNIKTYVQFNCDLKNYSGYTSVSEIKDVSTNTHIYEYLQINKKNNNWVISSEFTINGLNRNKSNLIIPSSSDLNNIMNGVSDLNFGIMYFSGIKATENILFKMIKQP